MRSSHALFLSSLVIASAALAGCANTAEDETEEQTANVTGGSTAIESPVVYLFEGADATVAPKCAGALLGDTVAVTAKACAKEGLVVGRAADENGRGERAKITKVHVPTEKDADIAVVELDRAIGGTHARITHMPLRDGYAINSIATADGTGILSPDQGQASSIKGSVLDETETHGTVVPEEGSAICDGDIGAPVCSSTGAKIPVLNYNIAGTCGLSGIVVGRETTAPPANGAAQPSCSPKGWKLASLGRYAEFLKAHAPGAFEPLRIDKPIIRNYPFVPDGLWGYETKGQVKACKIETTKLEPIVKGVASGKIVAKVAFEGMEKRAVPYGRFGIAPKKDPTKMRWAAARALGEAAGEAFEAQFEGIVSADKDGEYVVAFRASANGGESWTLCDTDGGDFSAAKALELRIGDADTKPPQNPGQTEPQDTPPSPGGSGGYSDPPPSGDDSATDGPDDPDKESAGAPEWAPSRKTESSGCSAAPGGSGTASTASIVGVLLGFAAWARSRSTRRASK